ncbi:class I SAM-dependent methyltransferase [Thermoproteota archaeon]
MQQNLYDFHKSNQFKHWWFNGRKSIIETLLKQHCSPGNLDILDIGSGYGVLIPTLKKWGKVDALEPNHDCHDSLKQLGADTIYPYSNFPLTFPNKQYDLICLFDVLEHIENHEQAIQIIKNQLLKPNGKLLITVPSYQWLWTTHDEDNHHYRRYSKKMLLKLLKSNNFNSIRTSYFMTLLFPLAVIQRLISKMFSTKTNQKNRPHFIVNAVFEKIFHMESKLISKLNLPYGLSIISIAEG